MSFTPKLSIVLYLYKNSENLDDCLEALSSFNHDDLEIIIQQDPGSDEIDTILTKYFSDIRTNVIYIRNQEFLGQSFCFNNGIKVASAPYIMFMGYNDVLSPRIIDELNSLEAQNYDVISIPSMKDGFYPLEENEYSGLSKELIVNCGVSNLRDKIFRINYLKDTNLTFEDEKWYPDVFMLNVLLSFKKWWNILGDPLIDIRKEYNTGSNLYDFLYQVGDLFDLAIKANIYEEYKNEIDFWITTVCVYEFLSKIYANYSIHLTNKKSLAKNQRIIKLAMKHVKQVINRYVPNFQKNIYFKKYATKMMKFFNKSEKIL